MTRTLALAIFAILAPTLASAGGGDDPAAWKPVRIPGKQKAAEFADIDAWINSEPIKMKELKGKVVVVHFLAFG